MRPGWVHGVLGVVGVPCADTHPFDALLEQRGDLALAQAVHQLFGGVVRREELHAVDEPVQFLSFQQNNHLSLPLD